jgi:hypothetical protein
MTMQDVGSNLVYVVSLGTRPIPGTSGMSTIDVLTRLGQYFCPVCPVGGANPGGWPKEPPNYLGFRFRGRLQEIHHVEGYEIHTAAWEKIPELAGKVTERKHQQFLFELGPAIRPPREVRTGKLFRAAGPSPHVRDDQRSPRQDPGAPGRRGASMISVR